MKEELNTKSSERSILVTFLVGGLVGAGIALLLAPKSGKEIRNDIKEVASKAKDRVITTIEEGKSLLEEGRIAIAGAVDAGKKAFIEERDKHLKAV
jgi:gas vesicle protein